MKSREYKVREIIGKTLIIDSVEVDQIDAGDFLVFRSKVFLPADKVESFLASVRSLHPDRKAILLPTFIEVCKYTEGRDGDTESEA